MEKDSFRIGDIVLYKNNQLIAFNKPATLPVQEDLTGTKSLSNLADIYCKAPTYLIHRLDRPASGVVLFAKNKKALAHLNKQFQDRSIQKTYLAVVKNKPALDTDTLVHHLKKNSKTNQSRAFDKAMPNTKEAKLEYELLDSIDNYHLLKIHLITGRHHQIRAQLQAMNNPIKGDVKYGFRRSNKDRSIHLHAWRLEFTHPTSYEREIITAPLPLDPVWDAFQFDH